MKRSIFLFCQVFFILPLFGQVVEGYDFTQYEAKLSTSSKKAKPKIGEHPEFKTYKKKLSMTMEHLA